MNVMLHASALLLFTPSTLNAEDEQEVSLPEYGLCITLPELDELAVTGKRSEQNRGSWKGKLNDKEVTIDLVVLPNAEFHFEEPEDVVDLLEDNYRNRTGPNEDQFFAFHEQRLVNGSFGYVSYACIAQSLRKDPGSTADLSSLFVLGALTEKHGLVVEVECSPPSNSDESAMLASFLELNIKIEAPERNLQWSVVEAKTRWEEHAPPSAKGDEFKDPIRTVHYIILTNSSGGTSFAKKMEENYKKIKDVYPFQEVKGRKLMPVFLFRTNNEYYDYSISVAGKSREQAMRSKGHAWKDYYATWYESPNDPVHIHEATHQIFKNRLRLNGGGSWFQEGVAEYIETKKNDRNAVAGQVVKGRHTKLRELMTLKSLLQSSGVDQRTGDKADDHYTEAALLMEFLRESKWGKPKFAEFLQSVGHVARNDVDAIEKTFKTLYQVDLDGLEEKWKEYCKQR